LFLPFSLGICGPTGLFGVVWAIWLATTGLQAINIGTLLCAKQRGTRGLGAEFLMAAVCAPATLLTLPWLLSRILGFFG